MAKTKAKKSTKKKTDPEYWDKVLESLQSGDTNFIFIKPGRTRIRLLRDSEGSFYQEVESTFRGRTRTKYMLLAYSPDVDTEDDSALIKGLLLSKTAFRGAVTLQAEGYELFDPEEGYGLTIVRTGSGLDTDYTVLPSKKPIEVPEAILEELTDVSLVKVAKAYTEFSASRGNGQSNSEEKEEDESAPEDW
jgi:hypothetical protein